MEVNRKGNELSMTNLMKRWCEWLGHFQEENQEKKRC